LGGKDYWKEGQILSLQDSIEGNTEKIKRKAKLLVLKGKVCLARGLEAAFRYGDSQMVKGELSRKKDRGGKEVLAPEGAKKAKGPARAPGGGRD